MNNENAETHIFLTGNDNEAVQITYVVNVGITATLGTVEYIGTKRQQFIPARNPDEILFSEYPEYGGLYNGGWNLAAVSRFVDGLKTDKSRDAQPLKTVYGDCVMCGKEGGKLRSNGDCFCGRCWMEWNS